MTPTPPAEPARPPAADPAAHAAPPLDLARLVMRRAGLLALAVLALALVLGLARMAQDIGDEVDAAATLARQLAQLGRLARADDATALAALRALQAQRPPRHLLLQVHDAAGRLLLDAPAPPAAALPWRALLALHRRWQPPPAVAPVAWPLPRPDGGHWTVTLRASHEAERREALANLAGTLALLLVCIAGLLLVMRWNLRRALAPLDRLLQAIARLEARDDLRAVQALPPMPTRELAALAAALRRLGEALAAAEARRRVLAGQVLTLQEDERARLARELHDELGQHLTALRVDAAWLARQLGDAPALRTVVDGMATQCARLQQDVRALLARLQPFGPPGDAAAGTPGGPPAAAAEPVEPLARLVALLQDLVASWAAPGRDAATAVRLELAWTDATGAPRPWPADEDLLALPRPLALALYRISQEALTNVARHADARQALLRLAVQGAPRPGAALAIDWSVQDDGLGLPGAAAQQRGNGLAGIVDRVWAQGADLRWAAVSPGAARPGLRLAARFETRLAAAPPASPGRPAPG